MKKYKYALFDWDGCLCDTLTLARDVSRRIASDFGKEMTNEDFSEFVGDWDALRDFVGSDSTPKIKDTFGIYFKENLSDLKLNTHAFELLQSLNYKGIKIGIVTTSRADVVKPQMEILGISNFVSIFVGAEDVANAKPDPEPVLKGIELIGGTKEETLFIGDTEKDIIAASRAEVDSAWYRLSSNLEIYGEMDFEGHDPTYIIKDFLELISYF